MSKYKDKGSEAEPKLKAYLYHRVSKKIQTKGKGLERQREMAMRFLEDHPEYEVADIMEDQISAYLQKNTEKDAGLGGFLHLAESRPRQIPENSCLVVESIDRISRLGTQKGQEVVNRIFTQKIDIAITKYNKIFRHNDENDLGGAIQLLSGLFLGKLESDQKSLRIRATQDFKREEARQPNGKKFRPKVHPSWLKLNADKRGHTIIKSKAKIVQQIYQLKVDGMGVRRIARHLNNEGIKPISGKEKWTYTSVSNLLKNIAVKGEFQFKTRYFVEVDEDDKEKGWVRGQFKRVDVDNGEVVKDYYPRIIDDIRFNAVQDSFRSWVSAESLAGRTKGYKNLFRHLTKCMVCGYPMNAKAKYLVCRSPTMDCENGHILYEPLEDTLLEFFGTEDFLQPMSKVTHQEDNDIKIKRLKKRIDEVESAKRQFNKALGLTKDDDSLKDIVSNIDQCSDEIKTLKAEVNVLLEHKVVNFMEVSHIEDVDFDDTDERRKFNTILLDYIDYIKLYTGGYILIKMKGNNKAFLKKSLFSTMQIVELEEDEEEVKRQQLRQNLKDEVSRKPKNLRTISLSKVNQEMLNRFDEENKLMSARIIYQRKIDENLTRKQTTRIFTAKNLGLTPEEHSILRIEMGIPYPEDLKKFEE